MAEMGKAADLIAVAINVNTPESVLSLLAADPDRRVRLAVATNNSTYTYAISDSGREDYLC